MMEKFENFRWNLPPILGKQPNSLGTDFTFNDAPMHKVLILTHQPTQVTHYYNQTICPLLYKYIYKNHTVYRIKDVFPAIPGNAKD